MNNYFELFGIKQECADLMERFRHIVKIDFHSKEIRFKHDISKMSDPRYK
jgi:hypothetical protein